MRGTRLTFNSVEREVQNRLFEKPIGPRVEGLGNGMRELSVRQIVVPC